MTMHDHDALFRAMDKAEAYASGYDGERRIGVKEVMTLALLGGDVPARAEDLVAVALDAVYDVRPFLNALVASLLARPRTEREALMQIARDAVRVGRQKAETPFQSARFETYASGYRF